MLRSKSTISAILSAVMLISASLTNTVYARSVEDYKFISSTFNTQGVSEGPSSVATFSVPQNLRVDCLTVYHWNGGRGSSPGTIYLFDANSDTVLYSWQAEGRNGNTYWDCYPDVVLEPGSYYVKDSDWSSASFNSDALGGMIEIRGEWLKNISTDSSSSKKDVSQGGTSKTSYSYEFSAWAGNDIENAVSLGIIPENMDTDLTTPISRADFAAVAVKAYEKMSGKTLTTGPNPFNDSSDSYVLKAYNGDIVAGTSSNTFSPRNNLTREQAAAMLTRAYKKTVFSDWSLKNDYSLAYSSSSRFSDHEDIRPYARESVEYMASKGVINGMGNNMFSPSGTLTKEQAIAIACRMYDKLDMSPQTPQNTQNTTQQTQPAERSDPEKVIMGGGRYEITFTTKPVNKREFSQSELSQYDSGSAHAIAGYDYSNEDGDHLLLDHLETVSFDVSNIPASQRDMCYALAIEPNGESILMAPDPNALANGTYTYKTIHFSPQVLMKEEDKAVMDKWIKKAAYKNVMEGVNSVSLEQSLQETLNERMQEWGVGKGQFAGELVRYIASNFPAGEMITATVDGNGADLKTKLANLTTDYLMDKLVKDEKYKDIITGDEINSNNIAFLKQSLGEQADNISKGIANGDLSEQAKNIAKVVVKNVWPSIDKVEKYAIFCDTMKKLWENDTIEWFYEKNFKEAINNGSKLSLEEFNSSATALLHGAGVTIEPSELYKQFELRYNNEQTITQTENNMKKYFEMCNTDGFELFDASKWNRLLGDKNTMEDRLNRLWLIRNHLKEMCTVNGKLSKGEYALSYGNDEQFLAVIADQYLYYLNQKDKAGFYQFLVDEKILTISQAKKYYEDLSESTTAAKIDTVGCPCKGTAHCNCDDHGECRNNPFSDCELKGSLHSTGSPDSVDINISETEVPVEELSFTRSYESIYVNESFNINEFLTVYPENASKKGMTYLSSDTSVATVTDSGEIIAGSKKGETTITVRAKSGVSGTFKVYVFEFNGD